jgi:hypothetical protein
MLILSSQSRRQVNRLRWHWPRRGDSETPRRGSHFAA